MQDLRITASLLDNLSGGLNTITESLGRNKKAAESAKKSLGSLSGLINQTKSAFSGLSSALASGNFLGFTLGILGATNSLSGLGGAMTGLTASAGGLGSALTVALGPLGLITGAIAGLGALFVSAGKSAADLDTHLDSLLSLTGLDDSAMKNMSKAAIDMSKDFKASASDIVDSMKLIGSQAPELLKDLKGLQDVTEAANVLAEAGLIEVVDAAKAITTTMNQMNVLASEATGIINTLAAASQLGSADISYLNTAFEKAGTQAKSAGMSYSDLAAAIETVGPKFSSADVAGSKLQALLLALSVQTNDNFKPSIVGMSLALDNLAKAELTDAQMKEMVGASQITMLQALIEGKETYKDYTKSLAGTNTAYEQMALNNDNLEGTINKLKSSWDALMISLGQSALILGIISIFLIWMDAVRDCINYISELIDELPGFGNGVSFVEALGAAIKALSIPAKIAWEAIAVAISMIIQSFNMVVTTVQWVWNKLKSIMSDMGIFKPIQKGLTAVIDWFKKMIDFVLGLWNKFKKAIGMDVKEIKSEAVKLSDIDNSGTGGSKNSSPISPVGKAGKTTKAKVKVEAEPGSIEALKKQLSDLQKSLTSKNLSVVDIEKTKKQIADLQKEIDKKEMELGIKAKPGSLEYIESEISKINAKLKKLDPKIDFVLIQKLKVERQDLEDLKKEVEDALKPIEVTVVRKAIRNIDEIDPKTISRDEATEALSQLNSDLNKETDKTSENYLNLIDRIKKWTAVKEQKDIEINADLSDASEGSMKWLQDKEAYWNGKLQLTAYGTPEYYEALKNVDYYTKEEQKLKMKIELDTAEASEKFGYFIEGFNQITAPISSIDGLVGSFESLSKAIDEGANAWEVLTGVLDIVNQAFQTIQQTIQMVEFFEKLLGTTTQDTSSIQETSGEISQAVAAKEVTSATTTVSAKSGESIANATASGSKLPFPLNLVAIAAGVAAVISAFAAIGSFATGGIVGGNSYHGDKLTARVNSGEMILNGHQQKNLFDAINSGKIGGGNALVAGEVKVKGSDLYIALKNYGKTQSIIGKNIGIH